MAKYAVKVPATVPIAHEDHPQRALHAALAMQEDLRRYAGSLESLKPSTLLPWLEALGWSTSTSARTISSMKKAGLDAHPLAAEVRDYFFGSVVIHVLGSDGARRPDCMNGAAFFGC
jgi:hypothetical protein